MKLFSCDNCGQALFFENVLCLNCGAKLAVLPEPGLPLAALTAVAVDVPPPTTEALTQPANTDATNATDAADNAVAPPAVAPVAPAAAALWQRVQGADGAPRYRLCHNHEVYQACNFAVAESDTNPLCISCRQTQLLPDLSLPDNVQRWAKIEAAKRRMFYTLARLGLAATRNTDAALFSPVYAFLADVPGQPPVLTGHANGVITLNIAEADDDERARRRVALGEPYRTLLGHLRHESGHFYWDRLIRDGNRIEDFRAVFGDESQDYGQALQAHYANGTSSVWHGAFVSAYAQAHPWEDWAETWAHYLHMVDLLETAAAYQTSLVIPSPGPDETQSPDNPFEGGESDFDAMIHQWVPVTLLLNSLNRSLGQNDAYPFALSEAALHKLRFVHEVIQGCNRNN
ncbi:zinc-binding metallopeptidase family protein [Variovorax sp. HJSM1_2]|uniref:zinc-binding metallopeptidase family protein n=1 Tax=Variovorax sp. HJSM1_2 TaxID=3366263 RepID=UPI003BE82AF9